jgi:hypothetical protein
MAAHAKLSASGSHRWLNCPGSVKAEKGIKEHYSAFAQEGTCAHELAELVLQSDGVARDWVSHQLIENNAHTVDSDMADYVQQYVDIVKAYGGQQSYEQRVDFSDWIPEGFGTCDALIVNDDELIVVDLKYGKGIRVDAENNSQGVLYALGAFAEVEAIYDIKSVRIVIVQPRLDHVDEWVITTDELLKLGETYHVAAEAALSDDGERLPGEKQCQWCKAKATCPQLKQYAEQVIVAQFDDLDDGLTSPDKLTDAQLATAISAKSLVVSWFDAVQQLITDRLLNGDGFPGYKLVAGRSSRNWSNEGDATAKLVELIGLDDAFERKLLSPVKAEKVLGKTKKQLVADLIAKSEGKPTLALETDKRPAVNLNVDDFDKLS